MSIGLEELRLQQIITNRLLVALLRSINGSKYQQKDLVELLSAGSLDWPGCYADIAAVLGTDVATVTTTVARARKAGRIKPNVETVAGTAPPDRPAESGGGEA